MTQEPKGGKRRIADAVQGQGDRHKKLENPSHERGVVCGCHGVRATGERRFVDVNADVRIHTICGKRGVRRLGRTAWTGRGGLGLWLHDGTDGDGGGRGVRHGG